MTTQQNIAPSIIACVKLYDARALFGVQNAQGGLQPHTQMSPLPTMIKTTANAPLLMMSRTRASYDNLVLWCRGTAAPVSAGVVRPDRFPVGAEPLMRRVRHYCVDLCSPVAGAQVFVPVESLDDRHLTHQVVGYGRFSASDVGVCLGGWWLWYFFIIS